ncbi:cytochrome c oxidase subunit 3 [Methylocystis sp. MJC1]|uniref:cytochrome c oxidase subunit 3 n=1 Tax=Methylocystis sp. MJC1 TaxID=2654282 RepID=UPI0013EB5F7D|nr:cytochrome c oxidase subunit 3 [Methylocystis sp. MJC1]KAF2992491.1 putative cytochrome c oxidase subunit 3 [Methylocystis sp. MJC1]MBU6526468.1 cytochrome c oxidase subunit 3 [Methylocystis sp. MJC1]UZX12910.1 cytochrome c oxidase subunit 3 [Methylocystis sp. MJC1]
MSVMGLFFICVFSVAITYLWREGILEASWLQEGEIAAYRGKDGRRPNAAKTGLVVFLAVALCLFSLLAAAFFMRMGSYDWLSAPLPRILWFNTVALIAASGALHVASTAATTGARERMRNALWAGAVASLAFLSGQLWAWRDMIAGGFYASQNPANAFFFLLTGAHALHLMGGLFALFWTIAQASRKEAENALAKTVELCAIYWHFLLAVWLLVFALLVGWADNLGVVCRRLLS